MKLIDVTAKKQMNKRFRGFLPVVVDVETAGVVPHKNALLEISVVLLYMDDKGLLQRGETLFEHILPFDGAELDAKSLEFNQIDPFQPLRFAKEEKQGLDSLFKPINEAIKKQKCQRAVLVGHNAWFDLLFIKEACKRQQLKSPFHSFTCFDTASLSAMVYGQTVLAKALQAAKIAYDPNEAHSAIYDAEITADLFCKMMNCWKGLVEG